MAIDRIDRTVVTSEFPMYSGAGTRRMELRTSGAFGLGVAVARAAVMLVLASLAILVLLPAAIAAQAAATL